MAHNSDHPHLMVEKIMHDRMSPIYFFQALTIFVKSLFGVFAPVYMYANGYPLYQVFLYAILFSFAMLFIIPIAVKLIRQIGFKFTMFFSVPMYMGFIIFLNYIDVSFWFAIGAWAIYGMHVGMFWPAYHSEIALSGHNKKRGSEIGTIQMITALFATIAPIIGGYLLEFMSYMEVLILGCIILVISFGPLYFAKNIKLKKYDFNYKDYFRFIGSRKHQNSKRAFVAEGLEHSISYIGWPIFLFIILSGSYFALGTVMTVVSLISVLVIRFIKKRLDRQDKHKVLFVTSRMYTVSWIGRLILIFIGGILTIFIESFARIMTDVFRLPYQSIFYNNAKRTQYLDYIIMREFFLACSRIISFSIFALLFALFGEGVWVIAIAVITAAVGSLGIANYREERTSH